MKKKKLIIILLSLGMIVIALSTIIFLNRDRTPRIFEIKGEEEIIDREEVVFIEKYCIVVNHPKNTDDLQVLVDKYCDDNYKKIAAICKKKNKKLFYDVNFFRVSRKTPKRWHPRKNYFFTDEIDNHKDDCIARISYSNLDPENYGEVCVISSKKKNYGDIIERKKYKKIIETDLYEGKIEG